MIFVTVGTQLPFDRLIKLVDDWAKNHPDKEIIVQAGSGGFEPTQCELKGFISASEWETLFLSAELVVAHAGMGTIIKCIDAGKPLIVMPRRADLNEHRNDHQLATVGQLKEVENIVIVQNEHELNDALNNPPLTLDNKLKPENEKLTMLINEIKSFIGVESHV